jgi:hypothetical protein
VQGRLAPAHPALADRPPAHELKRSHQEYEGVHRYWRTRYKVGADDRSIRAKARGIGWHRLRANVACLIDWLRILIREGWLGSPRRNHKDCERPHQKKGEQAAIGLLNFRLRAGLGEPYGKRALALDYGKVTPPSRRPRGQPDDSRRSTSKAETAGPKGPAFSMPGSASAPALARARRPVRANRA